MATDQLIARDAVIPQAGFRARSLELPVLGQALQDDVAQAIAFNSKRHSSSGETFVARGGINEWAGLDFFNPTKVLGEARRQGYRHEFGGPTVLPREVGQTERRTLAEDLDAAVAAAVAVTSRAM